MRGLYWLRASRWCANMIESVTGFIFDLVSSPWLYLIAAFLSFSFAYKKVAIRGAGIRNFQMAQLYFLFGVIQSFHRRAVCLRGCDMVVVRTVVYRYCLHASVRARACT